MKYWATMLAALAVLSATLALAEDFKIITGKEYKDATITRVESDGIVLRTKTGISKVYFTELPKDVQEKFHYRQAMPVPAQREHEPIKLEAKQEKHRQADKGHRVVVVGQSASSIKVIAVGVLILVVVVLVIVRSRYQ